MPHFGIRKNLTEWMSLVLLVVCISNTQLTIASGISFDSADSVSELKVQIGFDRKAKLGSWAPVLFEIPIGLNPKYFQAIAMDGNGLPVTYRGPIVHDESTRAQGLLKIGRRIGEIRFSLFDESNQRLCNATINLESRKEVTIVDSTVPMVLTIEAGNQVAMAVKSIERQLLGCTCEVIAINSGSELPLSWPGYQGVQVIYLASSNVDLVRSISNKQTLALEQWVANGGKLVFGIGENSEELFSQENGLSRFLPGQFETTFEIRSSGPFDQYARSKQHLLERGDVPIKAALIREPDGLVELRVANNPVVIRKPLKFGQIVFSAVDFDSAPLSEWNGLKNYLLKITFQQLNLNRQSASDSQSRRVVHIGYEDLSGQLFVPLEKFSQVKFINFTIIAVLIAVFILCIGPGDYFLLRKLIGKMEWTWITFTFIALSFCALAVFLTNWTKPRETQINQLEIIDIDAESNAVRGNIWTNIYSPVNSKCNISAPKANKIGINTSGMTISWMGMPGSGLGGMRSKTVGQALAPYECNFGSIEPVKVRNEIVNLPVRVSSTKTLYSQYTAEHNFEIKSQLRLKARNNRIKGTVTNPLDVQLHDCRLIFENWAYVLGPALMPHETINVYSRMRERTAASYFSRRLTSESDTGGSVPWNPQESDMDRIAEIMMFYESGGGQQYTGLTHAFQPWLDLSETVSLRRAVFFGKIEGVCTQLQIDSTAGSAVFDQGHTFVRIVLPVEYE